MNEVQQNRQLRVFSEGARGNLFFAKKWFPRKRTENHLSESLMCCFMEKT